jgi:signal-transduction protein with cAMP-binding, CBS, and nucleotidyltransferase domain
MCWTYRKKNAVSVKTSYLKLGLLKQKRDQRSPISLCWSKMGKWGRETQFLRSDWKKTGLR